MGAPPVKPTVLLWQLGCVLGLVFSQLWELVFLASIVSVLVVSIYIFLS